MEEAIENARRNGAKEYKESSLGRQLLEEQIERGMRSYREAILEELPGIGLSQVDKRFPNIFKERGRRGPMR